MGENMKFLSVVFLVFLCLSANAATMCVPDLSTCESCEPVTSADGYNELHRWKANCCGIEVSGIGGTGLFGSYLSALYVGDNDIDMGDAGDSLWCLMLKPFVAPYINVPVWSWTGISYRAYNCESLFIPKCAVTYCSGKADLVGGSSGFD